MRADHDERFADRAVEDGLVSTEQVLDCRRFQNKEADQGRRYSIAQILIRRRFITCADLIEVEHALGEQLYECTECRRRYARAEIPDAGELVCEGCGVLVAMEAVARDAMEALAAEGRELAIPLRPSARRPVWSSWGLTLRAQ